MVARSCRASASRVDRRVFVRNPNCRIQRKPPCRLASLGASASAFGTIDLNTGAFALINNKSPTVDGFGVLDGSLFAGERFNGVAHGTLFQVNPATGAHTAIGSDTRLFDDDFGSTTAGLYAVGYDPRVPLPVQNLYSINPLTSTATLIGPTGLLLHPGAAKLCPRVPRRFTLARMVTFIV